MEVYFTSLAFSPSSSISLIFNYIQGVKKGVPGCTSKTINQSLLRYGQVSVCVGILGDQFLGPVVLLTGAVHHRVLINNLPVLLEHAPLYQRQHMWYTHDGAPPHCQTAPEPDFR
jgi:hypothetical protein